MKLKWLIAFVVLTASGGSHGETAQERFAFFQKVGVMKRAANVCDDRALDQAVVNILNTPTVQSVQGDDAMAADAIVAGVVMFNQRVKEQGLAFNCQLVKALAKHDGYLP
jgi:hypothetical protein